MKILRNLFLGISILGLVMFLNGYLNNSPINSDDDIGAGITKLVGLVIFVISGIIAVIFTTIVNNRPKL